VATGLALIEVSIPCGENGEFHTFVHAGPVFAEPVGCEVGEVSVRDGFAFCDVRARAS